MSEQSSGVTAGPGIKDDVDPTETKLMDDQKSIDLYLELLKSGYEFKRDIRLVVVGKKGSGKTSFIRRLFGEDIVDVTSTNGIEIHKIKCKAMSDDGIWTKLDENYEETQTQARLFKEYSGKLQDKRTSQEPVESHIAIKDNTSVTSFDESKKSSKKPEINKSPEVAQPQSEPHVTPQQPSEQAARNFETMLTAKSKVDVNDKEEYATFFLWDFAGDEEFYHTHQTFLSQDAIYLVVTKLDEADDHCAQDLFRLWIDSIHCYSRLEEGGTTSDKTTLGGNYPPVVIVGTHKDAVTSETDTEQIEIACRENLFKYTNELADDELGHVRCEYYISNIDDDHSVFQQIRQSILNLARGMRTWNIEYPLKFIQLEQRLQEKKKELPIISYQEIKKISTDTLEPLSEEELIKFLEFHHAHRGLVYFKDLPDSIILDTQWLSDAFKCIVTAQKFQAMPTNYAKWDELYHRGKLNKEVLEDIFKKGTTIFYNHKEYILKVMEIFDIIIRPNQLEGADENRYYYVPCMIKAEPYCDIYDMFNVTKDIGKRSTWFCFKFIFLPPHLIHHLIASLSKKYTVAEVFDQKENKRQIALFKGTAVFEIDKTTKLRKLLVKTYQSLLLIQVLEYMVESYRGVYKDIVDFVTNEINKIISSRFQMSNVKFEKKWECGLTKPESVTGRNDFSHEHGTQYYCETCGRLHLFIDEWSDSGISIMSKLNQLNKEDFDDLVAQGTFASYENRVFLAGPCNTGKSSLASVLMDEEIPRKWVSTDGLVIHFGRNGIDLKHRKMVPLKGSGNMLTKVLLGKPKVQEEHEEGNVEYEFKKTQNKDKNIDKIKTFPLSNEVENKNNSRKPTKINQLPTQQQQQQQHKTNVISSSDEEQLMQPKPLPETYTLELEQEQELKPTIQEYILGNMKEGSYTMDVAPSDLIDFGGQKSFDMTHQLFMQHRGTFILMFDGSKGLVNKLKEYKPDDVTAATIMEHWITSVLTYCNKSDDKMPRILFAATHSDKFNQVQKENLTKQFQQTLTDLFSSHKLHEHIVYDKVFFVDARDKDDLAIGRLKDTLVDIAYEQSTWGQQTPIVWLPLDLLISKMREDGVVLITKDELLAKNRSNNEFAMNDRRVEVFLLVQHSIGKLLYFDEPALKDFIVIQPTAMVNILRAFITDRMFWPKGGQIRDILENLSSTGVLHKKELFTLWSQPAFKDILTDDETKEYVVQVLLHLDILVEPKRYTEKETKTDLFLVPCMVKKNIPLNMLKNASNDRTICIIYHLRETAVPSALSFKLIGASISIWPLKEKDSRFCLYSQAAILDAGGKNELLIHVEGQKIIVYLTNKESKQFISPGLATTTHECLTLALERILQFYRRCLGKQSHHLMSDLFEIEVGEICNAETCLITLSEAKMKKEWTCKNNKIHQTKLALNWVCDKNTTKCDSDCKGLEPETLVLIPDNQHFVQLAKTLGIEDFKNFFIALGMTEADYANLNFCYISNPMDLMLMGLFEWREKTKSAQSPATFEKLLKALTAIDKQHYLCQVHKEDHTFVAYNANIGMDVIPSNDAINELTKRKMIDICVVHLGVELGLSINSIKETIVDNHRKSYAQIHDLLIKWKSCKETNMVPPTVYRLMVALSRVSASRGIEFLKKTYCVQPDYQFDLKQKSDPNSQDGTTKTIRRKPDFSDILDQMMTHLVISVEDMRLIEKTNDRQDAKKDMLIDLVKRRGQSNISVCIGILQKYSGYDDHIKKLYYLVNDTSKTTSIKTADVPDYKVRLQKNYFDIINTINHNE